jgi:chromosome segregation ATPase
MHPETKLEKASADVTTWRDRVRTLNENIAKAEAVAAASIRARQENVLAASLGDSAAKENLATVLEDDRRSERHLSDLQLALPLAMAELANAEGALKAAETEFRKKEIERLARARVEAASEIDRAFADFSRAWANYESLGSDLLDLASQEPNANVLYLSETVSGVTRLAASLPAKPFLAIREKFNFMPISTSSSLAAAEAAYWRLPPDDETKAA